MPKNQSVERTLLFYPTDTLDNFVELIKKDFEEVKNSVEYPITTKIQIIYKINEF